MTTDDFLDADALARLTGRRRKSLQIDQLRRLGRPQIDYLVIHLFESSMTNPITLIRRGWLLFQIRSLETTIDGQTDALACVADPFCRERIALSRKAARRELVRVRAAYVATLPAGSRVIWEAA